MGLNMRMTSLLLCLVLITTFREIIGAPDPQQTSSIAFNSDGNGKVSVSCNGKTFTAEGGVVCTSSASHIRFGVESTFLPILLLPGMLLRAFLL